MTPTRHGPAPAATTGDRSVVATIRRILSTTAALAALAACRGTSPPPDAQAEFRTLERVLVEVSDPVRYPRLTREGLEPLRRLRARDPRVEDARATCLRQYEAILQTQEDLAGCAEMEERLRARIADPDPEAPDPAALLLEAEEVCSRAFRGPEAIDEARRDCDAAVERAREAVGLAVGR